MRLVAFLLLLLVSGVAQAAQSSSGARSARMSWTAPTQYTDGKPLDPDVEIGAYRIYRKAPLEATYTLIAEVPGSVRELLVHNQPLGNVCYGVTAVTTAGMESGFTGPGCKQMTLEAPTGGGVEAPTGGGIEN